MLPLLQHFVHYTAAHTPRHTFQKLLVVFLDLLMAMLDALFA